MHAWNEGKAKEDAKDAKDAPADTATRKRARSPEKSAAELDSELRAFFDGKAAEKGVRVKKPATDKKAAVVAAVVEKDPEAAAKELERKLARAKRFGMADPEVEKLEKQKAAAEERAKKDEAKKEEQAEKIKQREEDAKKKADRAKRFAAPAATDAKAAPEKAAEAAPAKDAAKDDDKAQ